jgi:hypothetical protein
MRRTFLAPVLAVALVQRGGRFDGGQVRLEMYSNY